MLTGVTELDWSVVLEVFDDDWLGAGRCQTSSRYLRERSGACATIGAAKRFGSNSTSPDIPKMILGCVDGIPGMHF